MQMAITEIEDKISEIIEKDDHSNFIYDFLGVYDIPKATITKLKNGFNNLSKEDGEIYLKNKLYYKETAQNLMQTFTNVKAKVDELGTKPRYIFVTDFKEILAYDTKNEDTLSIPFKRLPQKFEFFLAWNGIEKADFDKENPADIRAAERFAKLYDLIIKDNPNATRKGLNLFLIRILFCLFAEDTDIFEKNLFTNRLKQLTELDGSNLDEFIGQLFSVLDVKREDRPSDTPGWLADFPYVDGDLFKDPHESLKFTAKSRKLIIDAGEKLEWDQINPDILGSMLQSVASEDSRSQLGMHYTSVPNIMKVIKPLFLDDLREEFEKDKGDYQKLAQLYVRIGNIKFMDPACGSGNFLIVTYKQLRQLEIDIIKEQNRIVLEEGSGEAVMYVPSVTLDQFYGIEIDDFACDITRLSLWIAEHQMNIKLREEIDNAVRSTLPLQHAGAIVCGNALRLDWEKILPHRKDDEVYLFGNPPYLGHSKQSKIQKKEVRDTFLNIKGNGYLDYISCWFYLGSKFISRTKGECAFVTTNSICEGEQVGILWKLLMEIIKIKFAYRSFKWSNSARSNAGVTVNIIGIVSKEKNIFHKYIFDADMKKEAKNISPYLIDYKNTIVFDLKTPLTPRPTIEFGNKPTDGGGLIFSLKEYQSTILKYPELKPYLKEYIGSEELIKGKKRYVLWLSNTDYQKVRCNPLINNRMNIVKEARTNSTTKSTNKWADKPYSFKQIAPFYKNNKLTGYSIIIPAVSSKNRKYIPMGFVSNETAILSNRVYGIFNANLWLFSLLESKMHMTWINFVGGKLETNFSYSSGICYNAFPFPELTDSNKQSLTKYALRLLDVREEIGGTLAEQYGKPYADKKSVPMNRKLEEIHNELDIFVDRLYQTKNFTGDLERFKCLIAIYEKELLKK